MQNWHNFKKQLINEFGLTSIKKWLDPMKIIKFDSCNLYLKAENTFQINWFEEYIRPKALKDFRNNNGRIINIHISIDTNTKNKNKSNNHFSSKFFEKKNELIIKPDPLKKEFCFSSYFLEKENDLTYNILNKLSTQTDITFAAYNPIFIYGKPGSGKTHLLSALCTSLLNRNINAFYIKTSSFTEHVVQAFRLSALHKLREFYRNLNVLIIDDIHQIANKNATQEEFFHTFNSLHTNGCQLILSANVMPNHLENIEQRLISRFQWGITLPLYPAKNDAAKKILNKKLKALSLKFDKNAKDFILNNFPSPSEIEKALQAILLRSQNYDQIFDLKNISIILNDLILSNKKEKIISHELILKNISKYFDIAIDDILGKSQTKQFSLPRQIAMFFCREKLNLPYKKIGAIFNRDHSTVMENVKNIKTKKESKSKEIYYILLNIEKKLLC